MTTRDTYDILSYEEELKQPVTGINIQINTLVDAMIDAEKCLFHNSDSNLMPVDDQTINLIEKDLDSLRTFLTTDIKAPHPNGELYEAIIGYLYSIY